jgi:hypothetical protein
MRWLGVWQAEQQIKTRITIIVRPMCRGRLMFDTRLMLIGISVPVGDQIKQHPNPLTFAAEINERLTIHAYQLHHGGCNHDIKLDFNPHRNSYLGAVLRMTRSADQTVTLIALQCK